MKKLLLLLLTLPLAALAGDRVTFSDDTYSLEFPQGWSKAKAPMSGAEFARKNEAESVILAVQSDAIPEGSAADLDAMVEKATKTYAQAIQFKGEAMVSDGTLDSCQAKFITLAPQNEDEGEIGMFAILIDAKQHFIRITATMSPQLDKPTRDECLEIVRSFRRENAEAEEKEDDE